MSNDMNEIKKVKKVILFYNPSSGSGMFKNNLDNIIGRYQEAGYLVVPIRRPTAMPLTTIFPNWIRRRTRANTARLLQPAVTVRLTYV